MDVVRGKRISLGKDSHRVLKGREREKGNPMRGRRMSSSGTDRSFLPLSSDEATATPIHPPSLTGQVCNRGHECIGLVQRFRLASSGI
eukprot:scaffold280046_cov35-Tisochrysis_lutea.AAC.5